MRGSGKKKKSAAEGKVRGMGDVKEARACHELGGDSAAGRVVQVISTTIHSSILNMLSLPCSCGF